MAEDYRFGDLSIDDFTQRLSTREPVPGGGGAAALCACIASALGSMVASLTVGKKKYAEKEPEMKDLILRAERLRQEFLLLIDEDAKAFEPLSKAYGLPHSGPEETAYREKVMEKALFDAASAPLKIMEKAAEALKLIQTAAKDGSRIAVSDAGCAAAILDGALRAAALNVYVNTRLMKDRKTAEEMNDKTERLLSDCLPSAEEVYSSVSSLLKTR